jgi:hypothetical protein
MYLYLMLRVVFMAFLLLLWGYCVYAITHPKDLVKFTLDRSKRMLKFYGFKGAISATNKSAEILVRGHIFVLVLLTIYIIGIVFFGSTFAGQFIQ